MKTFLGNKPTNKKAVPEVKRRSKAAASDYSDTTSDGIIAQALQETFDDEQYIYREKVGAQMQLDERVAQTLQMSDPSSAVAATNFFADSVKSAELQEELSAEDEFDAATLHLDSQRGEMVAKRIDRKENGAPCVVGRNSKLTASSKAKERRRNSSSVACSADLVFSDLSNMKVSKGGGGGKRALTA